MTEGPRRDPRRLFSKSERTNIASRQHWSCSECGNDLAEVFHVHHVTPWSEGGPTDIENGVAVCIECHKTAAIRPLRSFELRRWQGEAMPAITAQLRSGQFATLSAAPGAGKTLFAAATYRQLLDSGDVSRLVVFVPNANLRTQWAAEVKALNVFLGTKGTSEKRSYDGVALTYHTLQDPLQCEQIIRDAEETATLFILDEVHHLARDRGGEAGAWAVNMKRVVGDINNPRHRVLNLSGTLFRSKSNEQISTIRYQKVDGNRIETVADYEISAGQLIREGQLRHIKVLGFDADMRVEAVELGSAAHVGANTIRAIDIDGDRQLRSKVLRGMVRDQRYITGIIAETIKRLGHASIALDGAPVKALVIADDIDHAEQSYAELQQQIGARSSFIAHGRMASAEAEIDRFRKSKEQAVLVAVQKVTEGFDVPDICVLTYLRSWKAPLFINQIVARAMRVTQKERDLTQLLPATVLVPNEAEIKAAFADVLVGSMRILDVPAEPCESCGQDICACMPYPRRKECPKCGYPWKICTCPCRTCGKTRYSGCQCPRIPLREPGPDLDLTVISDGEVADINIDGRHVGLHIVKILRETSASSGIPEIYIEQNADAIQQAMQTDPTAFFAFFKDAEGGAK